MAAEVVFDGPWAPLFDGYVAFRRGIGFKVGAPDLYRLAAFCSFLGSSGRAPDSLPEDAVSGFLAEHGGGCASTSRGYECMVRQFATYRGAKGVDAWVLPVPMITRASRGFAPYVFTADEMRRIFRALDEARSAGPGSRNRLLYQVLFRLLYSIGMRVGEALGLAVGDVDLRSGVISVLHGKGDVSRLVPYHPSLGAWLEEYERRKRRPGDAFFFESPFGGMLSEPCVLTRFTKIVLPMAGIPPQAPRRMTVHSLRHTFACHSLDAAARSGADVQAYLPLLATYMGHQDIRSTELYLRLTEERFGDVTSACHHVYEGILGGPDA